MQWLFCWDVEFLNYMVAFLCYRYDDYKAKTWSQEISLYKKTEGEVGVTGNEALHIAHSERKE
jgi:hypothetical protein